MIPLTSTCLREGRGYLILRTPVLLSGEDCWSLSSVSAALGEPTPGVTRVIRFLWH